MWCNEERNFFEKSFFLENGHLEDQRGTGKITITYLLGTDDGKWVKLAGDRDKWRVLLLPVPVIRIVLP